MTVLRTDKALEPIAHEVGEALKSVKDIAKSGFLDFGWEKATNELTGRNNEILCRLPDTVRISRDLARKCFDDEIEFAKKVDKIFEPKMIPDGIMRMADVGFAAQSGSLSYTAYRAFRAVLELHRGEVARHEKYRDSIEQRHPVFGTMMKAYALCEDKQGYYLQKATWKTDTRWDNAGMGDVAAYYSSIPSQVGIDASVDIEKLTSKQQGRS